MSIPEVRDVCYRNCSQKFELPRSDPGTPYDYTLLAFAVAAALPFIAANAALINHRGRSYFHAQGGAILITGNSLAGLVWIASRFINSGHFKRVGVLRFCKLWTSLNGLGAVLWYVLVVLRLNRMYELSKGIDKWSWKYYAFVALCFLPSVVLFLAILPEAHGPRNHPCNVGTKWYMIGWSVYSVNWIFIIAAIYRMRNQQDPVLANEYMQTIEYLAMAIVIVLLSAVAVYTGASDIVSGRCFLTFSICCLVFVHFWVCFGWLVYLCHFRPKEDMDKFENEMAYDGARALNVAYSQSLHFPSSEGAVSFAEASEELVMYKSEIQKLETQKLLLKEKIEELQQLQLKKRRGSAAGF